MAWKLKLWTTDGRKATMHGTADSGCTKIAFTALVDVRRVKFMPQSNWHSDPRTFELFVNKNCGGLSYQAVNTK